MMLGKLEGYKTYIVVILMFVAVVLKHFGIMDAETFKTMIGLLGAAGLATLKMGNSKTESEVKQIMARLDENVRQLQTRSKSIKKKA